MSFPIPQRVRLGSLAGVLLVAWACSPGLPGPGGARPVASRPDTMWVPLAGGEAPADRAPRLTPAALPPELIARRDALTLDDIVSLALAGSPDARQSWAQARAAAAAYGASRGAWFPTVSAEATATRLQTAATQGRSAVQQTVYQPSASFTWLLLDLGGRSGSIAATRNGLLAADWTHNATLQSVVAQASQAYFDYAAAKALEVAQTTTVQEAELNLSAAEERRRVGVATLADVLQARTALAQARLDLQAIQGNLLTTRGALAVATGFPANLEYDIDTTAIMTPVAAVADQVDSLIAIALHQRPDLLAARWSYQQARSRIGVARAARLPSIVGGGTGGLTFQPGRASGARFYNLFLGLEIPLFNGFTWEYNQQQAEANADAALARAESLNQQVIFQVFSAYNALKTATVRVGTAEELLTSASQSADAARGRYQGGVGTLLELISAENALAAARAQRIQARLGWQASLVQLARDAGVLDLRGESPLRLAPLSDSSDSLP